jgi:hypothetical protein
MKFPIYLTYSNVPSLIIKVKETSLPDFRLLENIGLKNPVGSYVTNTHNWFLVDLVEDVEEIRSRTDLSSVSDLGTVLGVILVLKRLDFSSTLCQDSLFANFGIQLDFRVETPLALWLPAPWFSVFSSINWSRLLSSGPDFGVRYRVSYQDSRRDSCRDLCRDSTLNLNKGRD